MILGLDVETVPNYSHMGGAEQDVATNRWLMKLGYELAGPFTADCFTTLSTRIACGPSPRHEGVGHAVVQHRGRVYDPHPSDDGVPTIDSCYLIVKVGEA